MPALEYGVSIWGPGLIHADSLDRVEKFWISNARFILNAPLRTPNAAIQGDLGWMPFSIRAKWQAVCLLIRSTCSSQDSLLRKAMHVQRRLFRVDCACWLANVRVFMHLSGPVGKDFWTQWWSGNMFNMRTYDLEGDTVELRKTHALLIHNELQASAELQWLVDIGRETARSGDGLNKLRTYAKFKSEFGLEPYLSYVEHEGKRLLLFKLRAGVAPLRIETGRYESNIDILTGQAKKTIPEQCRICQCCFGGVENELHFVLVCPIYSELRKRLLATVHTYCEAHNRLLPQDVNDLFNTIMASQDKYMMMMMMMIEP